MKKYDYEIVNGYRRGTIVTTKGNINTPTFLPVTTFSDQHPLDRLVQPYLKRISQCIMVSYHYAQHAQQMKPCPDIPVFIDSGGFASLFDSSEIVEHKECASIKTKDGEIHPLKVLELQELQADLAATLDFITPPGMDQVEAKRRQLLTIKNAFYALNQKRSKSLVLYASLQCWDEESARVSVREYAGVGFDGIAIGGLVPRAKDTDYIKRVVCAVREEVPDIPIHVFGIGKPETLRLLWALGVDTVDSSSYVRNAVGVQSYNPIPHSKVIKGPHVPLHAAISNLWYIQQTTNF